MLSRIVVICGLAACSGASMAQAAPASRVPTPVIAMNETAGALAGRMPDSSGDTVVIAVRGACAQRTKSEECVTNITRDQFERMLSAMSFNPQIRNNPVALRTFADSYAQALALANAAEKSGLDKDPSFIELMEIVRVRTLADAYRHYQQDQAKNVSPKEIEAYYHDNSARFEQLELDRIFIPKSSSRRTKLSQAEFEKQARAIADNVHERASKGEDMSKLQTDAYQQLGLTPPLTTDMGAIPRGSLPSAIEQDIFSTNAGEIARLEIDSSGFTIYKVRARHPMPLDRVKEEIVQILAKKNVEALSTAVSASVKTELNDQYFAKPLSAQQQILRH